MLKKIEDMNYYELLEVSPQASAQEIHKAYERVRKIYDPNSIALYSLFSPDETEKIRQRIEEAYRTLIYDENRRQYDLTLRDYLDLPVPEAASPRPPAPQAQVYQRREVPTAPVPPPPGSTLEPRPVPHAPPTPTVPTTIEPVPPHIGECTGVMLRMLREQRKLTVQNVADITKLSSRYIECIENEAFAKLPARPYLRGFLSLYAKALAYEPERIVSDYMKRYEAAMSSPKK